MTSDSSRAVYRILDASFNRLSEGLRTLEEWARFSLDDPALSRECKEIRHHVAVSTQLLPRAALLKARNTTGDVGTKIATSTEYSRESPADVVSAGIARCQQSLRVLEEYGKTMNTGFATNIEQARYRFYALAAELELRLLGQPTGKLRRERLAKSQLYALVTAGESESVFLDHIRDLCRAGVDVVQLRDPRQADRLLIDRAIAAKQVTDECGSLLIMNDRADLALAADCDGVHVGQDELPVHIAREILGSERLIGVSTHALSEAREAVANGADYIGCGPVFPSQTKTFDSFAGLEYLQQVAAEACQIPAFAIGGIQISNVSQVTNTGMQRIAVSAALSADSMSDRESPATAARELKNWLAENAPLPQSA